MELNIEERINQLLDRLCSPTTTDRRAAEIQAQIDYLRSLEDDK